MSHAKWIGWIRFITLVNFLSDVSTCLTAFHEKDLHPCQRSPQHAHGPDDPCVCCWLVCWRLDVLFAPWHKLAAEMWFIFPVFLGAVWWMLKSRCLVGTRTEACILLPYHNKIKYLWCAKTYSQKTGVQTSRGKPLERHLAPRSNVQDFCFTVFTSVPCAKGSLRHLHACSHVGVQNLSPFKTLNCLKDSNIAWFPKLGVPLKHPFS